MNIFNLKRIRNFLTILSIFYCYSAKSQSTCCTDEVITQQDLLNYTSYYRTNFLNDPADKKHTEWIYLPRNYFKALKKFFELTPGTDGVWVYFITLGKILDLGQQNEKNQILINMVASENMKPKFDILKAFSNISLDLKSGNKIHLSTHKGSGLSIIGPKSIFDYTGDQVLENMYRYRQEYSKGGLLDKKYSERLHICKEHIAQIAAALEANTNWKGVKMYFGSYNKKIICTHNEDEKQCTLLLLPVENQKSFGNFDAYNDFLKKKLRLMDADIYNHGSLCPQLCN